MPLELTKLSKQKVGFFRFKQLNGNYLLTNDIGDYSFLNEDEFNSFLCGKIEQAFPDKYAEFTAKGFIRDNIDFEDLTQRYAAKNYFLGHAPGLHIVVVTLRCDHKCIYCQAGSRGLSAKGLDMDTFIAEKVVDKIFESPRQDIVIEFQGGEPLVNFETVKFIIEYARKKNTVAKKNLSFCLVSNFTFMTNERMRFFIENGVTFCTSLDGQMKVHNKQRITDGRNNSYCNSIKWLKIIRKEIKKNKRYKYRPNALTTITKYSLPYPKKIVDEYVRLGLDGVHLRPVSPFGIKNEIWKEINFTPEEFINFYAQAVDYIIDLNCQGKKFYERTALIFLRKILSKEDPDFLDIRSPCGAGIGQLAYNFNGDVYACDEARMLATLGDQTFMLGNVSKNTYEELINSEITKTLCLASCLDNLAGCDKCVFKPYCGVCPIYNYVTEGNIFSKIFTNDKCKIHQLILSYIFKKMQDEKAREVFLNWTKKI